MTDPSPLSYSAIRAYAEKVGTHHKIYDHNGRADIDDLLGKLGGRIGQDDSNESMRVDGQRDFEVYLPSFTSRRRDRFTIAHELAHYFLHYLHPNTSGAMTFHRGGRSLAETQANVFASSLLMPEQHFLRAWRQTQGDPWQLAEWFDVSPAAAGVRAKVLDLT